MRVDIDGYLEKAYDSEENEFNDDYIERITDYFDELREAKKEFEEFYEEVTDDTVDRFVERFKDKSPTSNLLTGGEYREKIENGR